MRRLSNAEWARTVRDLLGEVTPPVQLLPEDQRVRGFDNDAQVVAVSPLHVRGYLDAAEVMASRLVASASRRSAVAGCDPTGAGRLACLRAFAQRIGRRTFRRPLETAEVDALTAVAGGAEPADVWGGVGLIVQAVLQSPSFLFRVEVGRAPQPGTAALTSYETATRLSFLLTGAGPEDALLDAAAAGKLDGREGVLAAARALLSGPRAREGVRSFATQWLHVPTLDDVERSRSQHPQWNDTLRAAMAEETGRLVDDLVWTRGTGFLRELLRARHTFVDASLAKLYGLPAPAAKEWTRADLSATPRVGVLTHASFLTVSASAEVTPIVRGKLVREMFLCETPPAPPDNIPEIPAERPGETARQRLERHRSDPACASCHALLDPLGFGLARFDEIGLYREKDARGQVIDQRGAFAGLGTPAFEGPIELSEKLAGHPRLGACLVEHAFQFAFARPPLEGDACTLEAMGAAFERDNQDLRALLLAAVDTDAFNLLQNAGVAKGGAP